MTQSDPFRSLGYTNQRTKLPSEKFDHHFFVPVPFTVERLIWLCKDKGMLDGRRYALMKKEDELNIIYGN